MSPNDEERAAYFEREIGRLEERIKACRLAAGFYRLDETGQRVACAVATELQKASFTDQGDQPSDP